MGYELWAMRHGTLWSSFSDTESDSDTHAHGESGSSDVDGTERNALDVKGVHVIFSF